MSNVYLASIANESFFVASLMAAPTFQPDKNQVLYVGKTVEYLTSARQGARIVQDFSSGQGIGISTRARDALHAYSEVKEIFGEWDGESVLRAESALKNMIGQDRLKIDEAELQFAQSFLKRLKKGAMSDTSSRYSCKN